MRSRKILALSWRKEINCPQPELLLKVVENGNALSAALFTKAVQNRFPLYTRTNCMQVQQKELLRQHAGSGANKLTTALLLVYLAALGWILLLKLGVRFSYMNTRRVSLIPFREYLVYHGRMDKSQILLNVLVFVPLGIYISILFSHRSFGTRLLCCFLISLGVESLQYALAVGAFDSTDIITNTLGGAIGLLVFRVMKGALGSHAKAQKLFNTLAVIGTALVLLLLLLLKMNMLPVRYQ